MWEWKIVTQLKARETIDENVAEIATYQKENEKKWKVQIEKIKQMRLFSEEPNGLLEVLDDA